MLDARHSTLDARLLILDLDTRCSTLNTRVGLLVKEIGILSCRSGAAEIGPADARGGPTDCDTLELMYGLVKNIKVVMDGGSVLMDGVHRTLVDTCTLHSDRRHALRRYWLTHLRSGTLL